jgi:hypothetical protein
VAAPAAEKTTQRHAAAEMPADPGAEPRREEQRAIPEIAEHAHGVNRDLGAGLPTGLSTVDPADMAVRTPTMTPDHAFRRGQFDAMAMTSPDRPTPTGHR